MNDTRAEITRGIDGIARRTAKRQTNGQYQQCNGQGAYRSKTDNAGAATNVYGWPKNILHWSGIHQCIVDLSRVPGRTYAIADGIVGMEGNGPIQGTPKNCGVIVAGRVLEAVDATCSRIMGIDPNQVGYLNAPDCPHYNDEATITQTGESPRAVRTNFKLIKEFAALRLA